MIMKKYIYLVLAILFSAMLFYKGEIVQQFQRRYLYRQYSIELPDKTPNFIFKEHRQPAMLNDDLSFNIAQIRFDLHEDGFAELTQKYCPNERLDFDQNPYQHAWHLDDVQLKGPDWFIDFNIYSITKEGRVRGRSIYCFYDNINHRIVIHVAKGDFV